MEVKIIKYITGIKMKYIFELIDEYFNVVFTTKKINHKTINTSKYTDSYWTLSNNEINEIRQNYKVIDVDWLDPVLVNSKMFSDEYFNYGDGKKEIVNDMLKYYFDSKDKPIYKKTDYLCNRREKICICNTHAHDFRKIYDGINYKKEDNFISWIKKIDEPF